jgi:RimJ/RimL family protein N-acetyltransferase
MPSDEEQGEVIVSLEMMSREELLPGRAAPEPIELDRVDPGAPQLLRTTYVRVWEPLASGGRGDWTDVDWRRELSRAGVEAWLARLDNEVIGLAELDVESNGDVGIVVFGLVPEFVGKGLGAPFLTLVTRLAWEMPGRAPARRIWVQTSSADHPNAISNYIARGFRVSRIRNQHA